MLVHFIDKGWLKAREKAKTDWTHVIGDIRKMNHLECVGETLRHVRHALNHRTYAPTILVGGALRTLPLQVV